MENKKQKHPQITCFATRVIEFALEEANIANASIWNNNHNNNMVPMYKPENHVNQRTHINNGNADRNANIFVK
jgi:hypothetical protein